MRFRPKLSYANVMSTLAVLLVVAGGSIAVAGVQKNQVKSKHVKNDTLKSGDLKDGKAVKSKDIKDGEVSGADVADGEIKGADVDEQSLDSSSFTVGRSAFVGFCDPGSATFVDCVGTTVNLPREGRVQITAAGGQRSLTVEGRGDCRLEVDDDTVAIPHSTTVEPGEDISTEGTVDDHIHTSGTGTNGFAITAVTDPLPAGSHNFELSCNEQVGNTQINDATISAVMVGSG
ncbi:MAG: hypothetical protein ACR2N5_08705 [Solirubrobacterales bacterium]